MTLFFVNSVFVGLNIGLGVYLFSQRRFVLSASSFAAAAFGVMTVIGLIYGRLA